MAKKQAKKRSVKVAVIIDHRPGSKKSRAHALILKNKRKPRQDVLSMIRKLGVAPATAASWYSAMRNMKHREQRAQ